MLCFTVGTVVDIMTQRIAEVIYRMDFFFRVSPASLGEHDNGAGAALKGSLNCTNSNRLCGVTGQMSDAAKLLEHLPVEHGCLCFTGNLTKWKQI